MDDINLHNLPRELITEILVWLPVKSLLCFRCVSKSFRAVIGSQSFINSHFKRCSEYRINHKLIDLRVRMTDINGLKIHALDSNDDFQQELVLEKYCPSELCPVFFSYCNGLVLLRLLPCNLSVWNPSTRKYRILPTFPVKKNTRNLCFGLGYDSTADDYKAVVIISEEGCDRSQVWIFGLRPSCWRRIPDCPYVGYTNMEAGGNGDCFVDGALHFICYGPNEYHSNKIVVFDVTKETFSVVSEPVHRTVGIPLCLHVFRGCLSVSVWMSTLEPPQVDIYVRKIDGVAFTWTRLYSVTENQFSEEAFERFLHGRFAYSKEGDKVFLSSNGNLCSYDLKQKTLQVIVPNNTYHLDIFSCIESLVPVD